MSDVTTNATVFDIKIDLTPITTLRIKRYQLDEIKKEMYYRIQQAPKLFDNIMMSIELNSSITPLPIQLLRDVIRFLHQQKITFVGIRNPGEAQKIELQKQGLAIFNITDHTQIDVEKFHKRLPTMILHKNIRSGQRIHAHLRDLVIFGSVNQGAEILSDGNIFIYGSLRGKALAGIGGDEDTRIYCKKLDAELLAIAGRYMLSHNIPELQCNALIRVMLDNGQFIFNTCD